MAVDTSPIRVTSTQRVPRPASPVKSPLRRAVAPQQHSPLRARTSSFPTCTFSFEYALPSTRSTPASPAAVHRPPVEETEVQEIPAANNPHRPELRIATTTAEYLSESESPLTPLSSSPIASPAEGPKTDDTENTEVIPYEVEDVSSIPSPALREPVPGPDAARYTTGEGDEIIIEPSANSTEVCVWFNGEGYKMTLDLFNALIAGEMTTVEEEAEVEEESPVQTPVESSCETTFEFDPRLVFRESALMKGRFGTLEESSNRYPPVDLGLSRYRTIYTPSVVEYDSNGSQSEDFSDLFVDYDLCESWD